jgi:hypothetical protein
VHKARLFNFICAQVPIENCFSDIDVDGEGEVNVKEARYPHKVSKPNLQLRLGPHPSSPLLHNINRAILKRMGLSVDEEALASIFSPDEHPKLTVEDVQIAYSSLRI